MKTYTRTRRIDTLTKGLPHAAAEAMAQEIIDQESTLTFKQAKELFCHAIRCDDELRSVMPIINGIDYFSEHHTRLYTSQGAVDFWPAYGRWKEVAKKGKANISGLVNFLLGASPAGTKRVDISASDIEDFQEFILKKDGELLAPKFGELVRFQMPRGEIGVIYSKGGGRVGLGSKLAHDMVAAFKDWSATA